MTLMDWTSMTSWAMDETFWAMVSATRAAPSGSVPVTERAMTREVVSDVTLTL